MNIQGATGNQTADEARFVTLLKFDVENSSAISNALSVVDEFDFHETFRAAVERLAPPDQFKIEWEGDGGLIVFGYPAARVDAAELAVRTALRLVEDVSSIAVDPRVRLQIRVGIASGRVGIEKRRYLLSRVQTAGLATRLMDYAKPGQVLIAEDTRRLTKKLFVYEELGVVELKGAGRQRVCRVVGESGVVSRFESKHEEPIGDIIGRDEVLARLSDAWSSTREEKGCAVCLVGDSGIGKSRLAQVVLEWAKRDEAVALEIDCTPSTGNTPLLPVGVLLRRIARIRAGSPEAAKLQAASELLTNLLGGEKAQEALVYLAPLFGIESIAIPLDKTREELRTATLRSIVDLVRAQAMHGPMVLLCEDLHWADATTAELVDALADLPICEHARLLLVATRWPKPVTNIDLDSVTAKFTTISIEPLNASNAAHLVRVVAKDALDSQQVDDVVTRCGGVPLLLEEVARGMVEQVDTGAPARTSLLSEGAVPAELQLVVESRLQQWPPHRRRLIQEASVLGREFPLAALAAMTQEAEDVVGAVTDFAEHGMFEARPNRAERASFRHALLRDAVYETLVSKEDLRRLHSRAADALLSRFAGTPDASPEALAEHLRKAQRLDEAIVIRLAAAQSTFERGGYIEAEGHCTATEKLLDEATDRSRAGEQAFRLAVLAGMIQTGLHGYSAESAVDAYKRADAMCDEGTPHAARYPVARGLATAWLVRGDLATAHGYSGNAVVVAKQSRRADYLIDAMSVRAYTTLYYGRLKQCRAWIERTLRLYDQQGGAKFRYPVPQDAKTAALALLPTAAWLLGDADGAENAIELGLQHIDALDREFDKALLHAWTAGTRYTQRRYGEALQHAVRAADLGVKHNFEEWAGVGMMMAALSQSAVAPAPEALAMAKTIAQKFQEKGVGLNASYFLCGIARGLVIAGDRLAAAGILDVALQVAAASGETRMNPEIWMLQSEIAPEPESSRSLLFDAYHLAKKHGAVANALRAAAMILDATTGADNQWARETLDLLDGRRRLAGPWMHERLAHADATLQAEPRTSRAAS